jgi:hypothetical protein
MTKNKKFFSQQISDTKYPVPEGNQLSELEIDELGSTIYTRFYQKEGGPDYKHPLVSEVRTTLKLRVKQVLDALKIRNFDVTK